MTIGDLISRLSSYPGDLDVKVLVLTRDGMFNDAVTANGDRVQLCEADGAVWITGSSTGGPATSRTEHHGAGLRARPTHAGWNTGGRTEPRGDSDSATTALSARHASFDFVKAGWLI